MRHAFLIHGWVDKEEFYNQKYPTASNSHWFPWLSKQLIVRDIHAVALEMPKGYYPEYEIWKKELERYEINQDTILVGHSCGGGFIVRYLSENNIKVNQVVLVAPWMGIFDGNEKKEEDSFDKSFFEFTIDKNLANKANKITLFESENDVTGVKKSCEIIKNTIDGIEVRTFKDKGHFTLKSLGTEEFPELLEEIVG